MKSKFNVSSDKNKRTFNGIVFDSEMEMKYYKNVVIPGFDSGRIKKYELQKPYELQKKYKYRGKTINPITYLSDFYIEYSDGTIEVIDIKGTPTQEAILKRKMMNYLYPDLYFHWVCYSPPDGGWVDFDIMKKNRTKRKKNKKKELEDRTKELEDRLNILK